MAVSLQLLMEQITQAFEKGDLLFLENHMTDDVQWNILGNTEPVKGKEAFLKVCSAAPLKEGTPKITITTC